MTKSWHELSWDPNAPSVVAWQQGQLDHTMQTPVAHRLPYLRSIVRHKRVLDIGVVEHGVANEGGDAWLLRDRAQEAETILGVDILADAVAALAAKGWNVRTHDVCAGPIEGEMFDVIVMGEVIEHLGAPSAMLDNLAPMLAPGGRVVITTPNPYMLHRVAKYLRGSFPDSVDHAMLLSPPNMAELGRRSGLELDAWRGVSLKRLGGARNHAMHLMRKALVGGTKNPLLNCDTVIYEFVHHT